MEINNTILSEQFQNPIEKNIERGKMDTLTLTHMTDHSPGVVQTLNKQRQIRTRAHTIIYLCFYYEPKYSLLVK